MKSVCSSLIRRSCVRMPPLETLGTNAIRLLCAFVLGVFIVNIYQLTHTKTPQKPFTDTLIILCMLISVVMVIIGGSIARAFSLVAALSIIRFPTAIQDPRDIGFVFSKHLVYERLLDKWIKKLQLVKLTFRVKLVNPEEWIAFFNELSSIENVTDVKMDKA